MHRNPGFLATTAFGIPIVFLAACSPSFGIFHDDQGPPDGINAAKVAAKCRSMDFDTTAGNVSEIKDLKNDGTVLVRIFAAKKSTKSKVKDLASSKGRLIGRAVNYGTGAWALMALAPRDTSCWHAWMDGDGIVHAQWVGLNSLTVQRDEGFEIKFHDDKHGRDFAQWVLPDRIARSEEKALFHLASSQPQQLIRTGNIGWTTCLVSGCCRSRQ
jgi:hypothetical protein